MSKNYEEQSHQSLPAQATYWFKLPTPNRTYLDFLFETNEEKAIKEFEKFVDIIEKKKVDLIAFYLCDMQCCMATVKDNINKTEEQTKIITKLANKLGVKVVFGGQGLEFLPSVKDHTDYTFLTYKEFKKIIT